MSFDGIVTKCIVEELKKNIILSKINKVYEPTKNDIILGLYANGKNFALNISTHSTNCRIHLTTYSKPNPLSAPNFCMLLRKHLIGGKIIDIKSYDLERIIEIDVEALNELNDKIIKKIYIEIIGGLSNIVLTNSQNVIIDALKHVASNNREIMPARFYEMPSSSKHSLLTISSFEEFYTILKSNSLNDTIDKELSNSFIGISRPFVQHCLEFLRISNFSFVNGENIDKLRILFEHIRKILNNIGTNSLCCVNSTSKSDFTVTTCNSNVSTLHFNFFVDDFYYQKETNETFTNYRNNLLKLISTHLDKSKKKLLNINNKLKDCDNLDYYKLCGELLTSNLYKLKSNISTITLDNYYDNSQITITLDSSISPSKNAEKYFKKYNKLKNTLKIVSVQKKETLEELKYIESLLYSIESCENIDELKLIDEEIKNSFIYISNTTIRPSTTNHLKSNSTLTSFITYNIGSFTVLAGKSNVQNDYLTFKVANKTDMWFHVKDAHGSHVVLKTENKNVPQNILEQCAKIAASNSKSKNSSNVAVDYCLVKYVKKPSGAKPGMVYYTNYRTLYV